jgi:hypothetical protein
MTGAFAGVRCDRVVWMGLVCGGLYRLIFWKMKTKRTYGLRDLIGVILLGVAFMVFVVLFHDSPVEIEVVAMISLGLVIEALLGLMWSRRAASESGAKGPGENGASKT